MYICGKLVELRLGVSAMVYHNFTTPEKLEMFFKSLK